jgi:glycosyltransferase involved in cell wall biosynthesis
VRIVKVFLASSSLLPSYGGPAVSVSRLASILTQVGLDVGLWAPDQSAAGTPLLPAGSSVRRMIGTAAEALDSFGQTDVIHDNGIWLLHNHRLAALAARRGIARIVSTRGMLEPWAMEHKRWKKRLAWTLYQRRDLRRARCHHATAEMEARNLHGLRLGVPIQVIPNGVDVPQGCQWSEHLKRLDRARRCKTALFIGRIYPVKGLPMLIEAWARVRPDGWELKIAGPDEAQHKAEVEHAVSATGLAEVVSFVGPVYGPAKQSAFFNADLFVLPSHSESFGMVVAEALAHGVPVLTTTGTPWSVLPERGCGWWVDATADGITEGLRQATSQDPETLRGMGERGRELVAAEFGWEQVAKRFVRIYQDLLDGRNPEEIVK